jgi:luciferase family oxidoreductase group 1
VERIMLRLSVLDQSPIGSGQTPAEAIANSLALARTCDALGYHRYWLAEHHSSSALAGSAPEIMIARIAGLTRNMRVGSGGVMLSHYSPLKVAETFRLLEALYPGRIDLGVGRAPGSDGRTAIALQPGPERYGIEHYPQSLVELRDWLRDAMPEDHPFRNVKAMPLGETMPELWLLASSEGSAAYAAQLGFALSFAHFISPQGGERIAEAYRRHYRPGPDNAPPQVNVGVAVICAETEARARQLALARDLWVTRLFTTGDPGPFPTVEEAEAHRFNFREEAVLMEVRNRSIVGTPDYVRDQLRNLADRFGTEEIVVLTICHDPEERQRSYELLAHACSLADAA